MSEDFSEVWKGIILAVCIWSLTCLAIFWITPSRPHVNSIPASLPSWLATDWCHVDEPISMTLKEVNNDHRRCYFTD